MCGTASIFHSVFSKEPALHEKGTKQAKATPGNNPKPNTTKHQAKPPRQRTKDRRQGTKEKGRKPERKEKEETHRRRAGGGGQDKQTTLKRADRPTDRHGTTANKAVTRDLRT